MLFKLLILYLVLKNVTVISDNSVVTNENNSYKLHSYENGVNEETDNERNGRLLWPLPQSPIIDLVLQTPAFNYSGDFFNFLRDQYPLPGGLKSPLPEYDFVIIGGGSAGSVLASRLSEDHNTTVLLLEAGKTEMILTDIPALAPYFQSTDYSWQYYMEHQPGVCMGMINERCFWPRGNALGGTSTINYMIYTRGRPQEWDRIAGDGNYGWSYNDVLKYYIKSETARLKGFENNPYRGREGELPVEFVPIRTKLIGAFLEAGRTLGHPTVDYNAPDSLGFGYVQVTQSNGRRYSSSKVFLHSHKNRRNLHILPESRVTKILIDSETKTAYGVEYVNNKRFHTVKARKEVILSAGPIASPQLLMLSGIGPKDHLSSVGIPVIKDLPVGRNLYDHICFPGLIFELNTTNLSFDENRDLNLKAAIDWLQHGDGVLTTPGGVEGIGYIKTPISNEFEPIPDIEIISIGGSIMADGGLKGSKAVRKGMRISEKVFNEAFGELEGKDTWSAFIMPLHPRSSGRIDLKDKNPFSFPAMYGNYLTDPQDVKTFIAGIRHVQALTGTEPFLKLGTRLHHARYPACTAMVFDSDEYWECAIRTLTATLHHQIATCRMGPENDPQAVVDPELRVYGIQHLRVIDSSVIPRTVSAHTHAPAVMIGEKGADMIKSTWNIK